MWGRVRNLSGLEAKAISSGASKLIIHDLKEELASDYMLPMLRAGAIYERKYLLGTSAATAADSKHLIDVAHEEGADAIAHGATGKGNDQVRFELTAMALDPRLKVIAPWREWDIRSREDAIAYAKAHHVPVRQQTSPFIAGMPISGIFHMKADYWKIPGMSRKNACTRSAPPRNWRRIPRNIVKLCSNPDHRSH